MAIYRTDENRALSEILPEERLSNQIIITGTDETMSIPKGAFFLELLQVDGAGSITFLDGNGNTMATGVTDFSQEHSPVRFDKGFTLAGDVAIAKGFIIEEVFA